MLKIMIDSASDCKEEKDIYDYFIPISVNINGREYLDGVDIDNDMFYDLLTSTKEFPRTSQPSPDSFVKYFEEVKENGDELIYFAISSSLSGTYQGATIAKGIVDYDGIYIIDTKNVSRMIGILAKYAKKRFDEGISVKEIVNECEKIKTRIKVFAGVDTLEYLYKGGRLSKASATVGTLVNIKPIVTITSEGKVEATGKCIGVPRAIQYIIDRIKSFEIDENFPVCTLYTCGEENCTKLEEKISTLNINVEERQQIGSAIGAHVGPGVYGIYFVSK